MAASKHSKQMDPLPVSMIVEDYRNGRFKEVATALAEAFKANLFPSLRKNLPALLQAPEGSKLDAALCLLESVNELIGWKLTARGEGKLNGALASLVADAITQLGATPTEQQKARAIALRWARGALISAGTYHSCCHPERIASRLRGRRCLML